ncbi:Plastid-lipid-associated protein, chloroplastic [Gracilariopsis chorda]|uniref:Plastid-lipid-associated protein, chloroplastic n=1 Tax=Gracilariopsis chorda TaxID=448386 RepID=A0A2V3J8M9_9FLOR|nr:Plastid-lipid-associated protein, chloroplastic [Gracilariopsis chorda]|eukprot:PXF49420.1 Plastid-lipid-associated protein, chloroplastic [Gracilariopsis chorda]
MECFIKPTLPIHLSQKSVARGCRRSSRHYQVSKNLRTRVHAVYDGYSNPYSEQEPEPTADVPFNSGAGNGVGSAAEPNTVIDASVKKVPLSDLKLDLFGMASSVNRGLAASPSVREQILALIEQIERENPTPCPTYSDLLLGEWRLVFTNALDVLSLGLLAPIALVSEVYQNIENSDQNDFSVTNVVNLEPAIAPVSNSFFGRTMGALYVSAAGTRRNDTRIDIVFKGVQFKPMSIAGLELPGALSTPSIAIGSPRGYIETTFLDEDIRILRAPRSNVFVLQRVGS